MTTPRVQAAYLRTICDGWCTQRRFQGRGACAFGCQPGYDGLEHYACCTVVRHLFATGLNLQFPGASRCLDIFLCMSDVHEDELKSRAVGLYALYRLYNGIRYSHSIPREYQGAFNRFIIEGLKV